jgi:hypothetical protein
MVGFNPRDVAKELGIVVRGCRWASFRVGSNGDFVAYAWHPDRRVREARMWEGIAQVVLTRAGVPWSEATALCLAASLKVWTPAIH